MIPTLFTISLPFGLPSLPIYSFGLMMVCCFLSSWRRLYLSLEEAGEDPALAERMITWAAVGGIVGARLSYVISFPEQFIANPLSAIFSGAGFVFFGGFVGGVASVWLLLRKHPTSFLRMADLTCPALAIGYAVGRVGCQLSGDGDFGTASHLLWAMDYPLGVVPTGLGELVHPTPVYESLAAMILCGVLLSSRVQSYLCGAGRLFGLYLVLSAVSRFFVEYIRVEPKVIFDLTQAQLFSLALCLIGMVLILRKEKVC